MYADFEIGIILYARVGISDEKGTFQLLKLNTLHYLQLFLKLDRRVHPFSHCHDVPNQ